MKIEQKQLCKRCTKMMDDVGISKTSFCKRIALSTSAFYVWKAGNLELSKTTLDRIDTFLARFGY